MNYILKIKKNAKGYNCACYNCGYTQPGSKPQPLLVYYKGANDKRGTNYPACGAKCAQLLLVKFVDPNSNRRRIKRDLKKAEKK